jgi:transposase-like protein
MPKGKAYPGEFKQMVIEDVEKNGLLFKEAARKYGINDRQVRDWNRIYLQEGMQGLYIERRGRTSIGGPGRPSNLDKQLEETLVAEVQRLRMENAYLKKLNALVQERERLKKKTKLK